MRFKIQQKGDAAAWYFEIGDNILANGLHTGRTFKAKRLNAELAPDGELDVRLHGDGRSLLVGNRAIPFAGNGRMLRGNDVRIKMGGPSTFRKLAVETIKPIAPKKTAASLGGGDQKSPLTGKVLSVLVQNDQEVCEGDVLCTIEAMKMENRILSEGNGTVKNLKVSSGQNVSVGDMLCFIQPKLEENGA